MQRAVVDRYSLYGLQQADAMELALVESWLIRWNLVVVAAAVMVMRILEELLRACQREITSSRLAGRVAVGVGDLDVSVNGWVVPPEAYLHALTASLRPPCRW